MTRHRIMAVYGTRPEAIKMAPVVKHLGEDDRFETVTVVSGQHREMLDQVNTLFGIDPDRDLDIFVSGAPLARIFSRTLKRFDRVLEKSTPDVVVVQGDTSTAAAAALAAFYRRIPVVHLEAGLRSRDIGSPFPEELNRRFISQTAALHLAPTAANKSNLQRERVDEADILVTGNTVIDALHLALDTHVQFADPRLRAIAEDGRPLILVTAHRRENWGSALGRIGRAVARLARQFPAVQIVVPMHRNPIVRRALQNHLRDIENVLLTEPLPYGEFTRLLARSLLVLSDSGGVQEEAPSLGIPVVLLRDNTERPEAVDAGTVVLVGTDEDRIVQEATTLLTDPVAYAAVSRATNPYGDGRAAHRAVQGIAWLLGMDERPGEFSTEGIAS
jgi:UDP-N-acetylglucosamine 2-epimerase (non-hydrolysing)